jgi:uncharacterized protein (DUF1697 family)
MKHWVALLKGVNVGGNNKVPMGKLRTALSQQPGWGAVRSYIASGNLVFEADGEAATLGATIEQVIAENYGVTAPALVLTESALRRALTSRPVEPTEGKLLHGFFPLGAVTIDWEAYETLRVPSETVTEGEGVIWLHTPEGFGRSKLAGKFDKVVKGGSVTARNLNTLRALVEMLDDID